jgi:hypothetical protein
MSAPQRTQGAPTNGRAAIITTAGLGVLVAVLVIVFVHVHSVSRNHGNSGSPYDLSSAQHAAVTAASVEAINVVSFSRKNFAADFARALNGATGGLKSDLTSKKALTLSTITTGKFDLSGTVATPGAYEGLTDNGNQLLVLITVTGFKVADDTSQNSSTVQRMELTMQQVHGKWLASSLNVVGIE